MWKKTLRRHPADNRRRASAARRLDDRARRLRNIAGENGQPLTVLSILPERRAPAQIIGFRPPSRH